VPRRTGGRGIGRLLALIAALAACAGCAGEDERADLLVTAPRLFDGERLIEDGAVAIRGDEIVAAGRREDVGVDAARTIALRNATLLPGLIDLHSHDLGNAHIGSVVTTVRDLGTGDGNLPVADNRSGPRILVAGPLITAPDGYPIPIYGQRVAHVVRTADEARAYVRSLASRGADVIKVALQFGFPVISFDVLRAIVAEAHAHDLRVTAHVGEARGTRMALQAGVDELAHVPCDEEPELMRALADAGLEIVGTLHVLQVVGSGTSGFGCPGFLENAAHFVRAGGALLYGSDYGVPGIPAGVDVTELELLAGSGGLRTIGALRAATSEAAKVLSVEGLGRLAEGSPADLVAVRGNAIQDLDALGRPLLVVRSGLIQVGG
jgi:imidazolonepropionase-like amidohydrolase